MSPWFRSIERLLAALLLLVVVCEAATAAQPPLILVSIDGYRADYLARGHSPVLASLATEGLHAAGMRPVFPSLTYPNHYTLVTGLYPDQHGVVNNTMRDPVLGNFSPPNRAANTDGRWWDEAEPIWITAQKQGLRTASVFYPGTQAEIQGTRPSYWQLFDSNVQPNARVDQVLAWLDLPPEQRPSFISLYFEQVDVAGHNYGPDSMQTDEAIVTVDAALGRLVTGLRERGMLETTNLLVLSDHGMSATSSERIVLLDKIVNVDHIELESSIVNAGINPKPGYEAEVARALLAPQPHLHCWKKSAVPRKYHYGHNARIPAIVCLTDDGWIVSTAAAESKRARALLGEHGYDNNDPLMRALFVAHGPSFQQHLTEPVFDNINIYALLAKLLGVTARPNEGHWPPSQW
ncbi:MAG: alkaline phosphatase family protein [Proteobacteria bacterium]|nr:alkaline phosphatase family protein [Pseudomonadota bacterium]